MAFGSRRPLRKIRVQICGHGNVAVLQSRQLGHGLGQIGIQGFGRKRILECLANRDLHQLALDWLLTRQVNDFVALGASRPSAVGLSPFDEHRLPAAH
jgi:hypothetical protein